MKVEIFTLCDASTISSDGKLNILGAFDAVFSPSVPVVIPLCSVAAKLRFMADEEGKKPVRLQLIDSDASPIGPLVEGEITVQVPTPESSSSLPLSLSVQQLELPDFGEYALVLTIGDEEASAPLYVKQLASPR